MLLDKVRLYALSLSKFFISVVYKDVFIRTVALPFSDIRTMMLVYSLCYLRGWNSIKSSRILVICLLRLVEVIQFLALEGGHLLLLYRNFFLISLSLKKLRQN